MFTIERITQKMEILIMIGQFILALSILVGLHEAGHMLPAKWFGMRVSKFFIGFPPTLFSRKVGETEYGIGSVPLGGFVKIEGMVDESLDTASLAAEPQPWEFRAKPAWKRLIVMLGGIAVNFVLGILIFIGLFYFYGISYHANADLSHGVYPGTLAGQIGFRPGDRILEVDGKTVEKFSEVTDPKKLFGKETVVRVERAGGQAEIRIPADLLTRMAGMDKKEPFLEPAYPFSVGQVQKNMPAMEAGLRPGDKILAINDVPVPLFQEFRKELQKHPCCAVSLRVARKGVDSLLTLTCKVTEDARLGFSPKMELRERHESMGFFQSVAMGTREALDIIGFNILGFGKIFSGEISASKSVSGPVAITTEFFGGVPSMARFWRSTAILSLILAFMNLLPIPALDGGHALFLTYEIIRGKAPGVRFMEWAQRIGMFLILGLMVFAFGNDILKLVTREKVECKCQTEAVR